MSDESDNLDLDDAIPSCQIFANNSKIKKEYNDSVENLIVMLTEGDHEFIEEEIANVKIETSSIVEECDDSDSEKLYHCSSCDINFESVQDHINEFHQNESVWLDSPVEALNENSVSAESGVDVKIEQESTDVYIEEDDNVIFSIDATEDEFGEISIDLNDQNINVVGGETYETGIRNVHNCRKCDDVFFTFEELSKHICPKSDKAFRCIVCNCSFSTSRSLACHKRVHGITKTKETIIRDSISKTCTLCNTHFRTLKSLKLHMRMHDPIKLKPIEDAIGHHVKANSKDDNLKDDMFCCEICNKKYSKEFESLHKKAHMNGPTNMCSICNKKFANLVSLTMHMKAYHEHAKLKPLTKSEQAGVKLPYPCAYCGREFARPHEKVKHERIHTGEKPYKCEICGKSFRVSYCLTLHLRTHTAARPYVCPHCNKRFKAYSVYNHHLMTHSTERPYKCPFCPKAFKTSVQLGGHKNSHTKPFTCPECNRPFASLYAVKAHVETHKRGGNNLKHQCKVCDAIYARAFALRDHMKEQHELEVLEAEDEEAISSILPIPVDENESSAQSIINENTEIIIGEIEPLQTEEVVTDWLK